MNLAIMRILSEGQGDGNDNHKCTKLLESDQISGQNVIVMDYIEGWDLCKENCLLASG